jgi:hypothetical protein
MPKLGMAITHHFRDNFRARVQAQTEFDPAQAGADKRTIRDPHVIKVRRWSARKQSWIERT